MNAAGVHAVLEKILLTFSADAKIRKVVGYGDKSFITDAYDLADTIDGNSEYQLMVKSPLYFYFEDGTDPDGYGDQPLSSQDNLSTIYMIIPKRLCLRIALSTIRYTMNVYDVVSTN